VSAVDADGRYQVSTLQPGDVWYFPKGIAHVIQGLDDENEYLLAFDEADFDAIGTTLMVDDWLLHTPLDVIVKNFGVSEEVFQGLLDLETDPYILNATVSDQDVTGGADAEVASGNNSFVYIARDHSTEPVPGGGGTFPIVDSTTFPIATTLAAAFVTLEPGGLRELHWHPNAQEWLYFHQGTARTFDFSAGDTAVFPDNSGQLHREYFADGDVGVGGVV
jgi:oxalate decarboxylase family bicupin protein